MLKLESNNVPNDFVLFQSRTMNTSKEIIAESYP